MATRTPGRMCTAGRQRARSRRRGRCRACPPARPRRPALSAEDIACVHLENRGAWHVGRSRGPARCRAAVSSEHVASLQDIADLIGANEKEIVFTSGERPSPAHACSLSLRHLSLSLALPRRSLRGGPTKGLPRRLTGEGAPCRRHGVEQRRHQRHRALLCPRRQEAHHHHADGTSPAPGTSHVHVHWRQLAPFARSTW